MIQPCPNAVCPAYKQAKTAIASAGLITFLILPPQSIA
jgi:hypothetical protein